MGVKKALKFFQRFTLVRPVRARVILNVVNERLVLEKERIKKRVRGRERHSGYYECIKPKNMVAHKLFFMLHYLDHASHCLLVYDIIEYDHSPYVKYQNRANHPDVIVVWYRAPYYV